MAHIKPTTPSTEDLLDLYSNQALLPMLKARGAFAKQTRKADMLAALSRIIEDAQNTRLAFDRLAAPQKLLLRLLREAGGRNTVRALKTAASRAGVTGFDEHLHELMRQAMVLYATRGSVRHELWRGPNSISYGWEPSLEYNIVGVPAALALAGDEIELPPPAHALRAFEGEPCSVQEQSPSGLLHAIFTVVRWVGEREIVLAKTTGAVKKLDARALQTQLKDRAEWSEFGLALAVRAGLLRQARGKIEVSPDAAAFFALPPREQVAQLYEAWMGLSTWSEFFRIEEIQTQDQNIPTEATAAYSFSDVPTAEGLPPARAFVMGVLKRSGSATMGQWQSLASLLEVVKVEEPEFLISHSRRRYYSSASRGGSYGGFWKRGLNFWEGRLSQTEDWNQVEGRFIRQMLCEPLLWLGLVATAQDEKGQLAAFRLTPLGAHLLGLAPAPPEAQGEQAQERPLIVQPNFEIIAYTEASHLRALYELERFAERVSAERVAHYKLSRASVHRGLQEGLSAQFMREFLESHSRSGVPQNIAYSLDDWQAQFERLTLHRSANVLEADSPSEMDALLSALPPAAVTRLAPLWAVIDPKYLEAAQNALAALPDARALDYALRVEQAFLVTEDLQIVVPQANLDLWLRSRLEQFADALPSTEPNREPKGELKGGARFEITRSSLARAGEVGLGHDEVMIFLEEFGTLPLPADVALTLRGWGGALAPVALGTMSVLVAEAGLLAQMAAVEALRPLLWLQADDRVALVRDQDVPKLRAELEQRGLLTNARPGTHLRELRRPKAPATRSRLLASNRAVSLERATLRKPEPAQVSARPEEDEVQLEAASDMERVQELLEGAIERSRSVVIEYQSKSLQSRRKVSPLEVIFDMGHDYLHAWDHWRGAHRVFRLDRILALAVLDEKFNANQFG